MNAEIQQKFVEALRSGEFQQGFGTVKSEDGSYCAMGVLQEVMRREGVNVDDGRRYSVDRRVLSAADMSYSDEDQIIDWNDDHGMSFDEIADRIEEEWDED